VSAEVSHVANVDEVATGPIRAIGWRALPLSDDGSTGSDRGTVRGSLVVQHVDYTRLLARPALRTAFEGAMRRAVASQAGAGVKPEQVELMLGASAAADSAMAGNGAEAAADTVLARVAVLPPQSPTEAFAARLRLGSTFSLPGEMSDKVSHIHGLDSVATGIVSVVDWHVLPEAGEEGSIVGMLSLEHIDYDRLVAQPGLRSALEHIVRMVVASAAGSDVKPRDVQLSLDPGLGMVSGPGLFGSAIPRTGSWSSGMPSGVLTHIAVLLPGDAAASDEVRSRLGASGPLMQAVSDEVNHVSNIHAVATGGIQAIGWRLVPAASEASVETAQRTVTGSLVVENVDYHRLMTRPGLRDAFAGAVRDALASRAGMGVAPERVELALRRVDAPVGMVVHIAVWTAGATASHTLRSRLNSSSTLCSTVSAQLQSLRGVGRVAIGSIRAKDWSLVPADQGFQQPGSTQGRLLASISLENVDGERLLATPALRAAFKRTIQRAIASEAGGSMESKHVNLAFQGGVLARATVSTTGSQTTEATMRSKLGLGARLCRSVAAEIGRAPGVSEVTTGQVGASHCRLLPESNKASASGHAMELVVLENVDFEQLGARPTLRSAVEGAIQRAVASEAGVDPQHVGLELEAGTAFDADGVQVHAVLWPKGGAVGAVIARSRLGSAEPVHRAVEAEVGQIPDIEEVSSGPFTAHSWQLLPEASAQEEDQLIPGSAGWQLFWVLVGLGVVLSCALVYCLATGRCKRKQLRSLYIPLSDGQEPVPVPMDGTAGLTASTTVRPSDGCSEEVEFRDLHGGPRIHYFQYRDHGLRFTQEVPPRVASFRLNSHARDLGVQPGWTLVRVGGQCVGRSDNGRALERLLDECLTDLPPNPLRLQFNTGSGSPRTFHFDRQPLGLELTKTPPFRVHHLKPDSHARDFGVEPGWELLHIGGMPITSVTTFDALMAYLHEGLENLPQDPKGLRLRIDFVDRNDVTRKIYMLRQPLGMLLTGQLTKQGSVVVEGFEFNSYAKDRGVQAGWAIRRIGGHDVPPVCDPDEVARSLQRHTANLPLWPLRLDFDAGEGMTRTFYFERQPLGIEFTKGTPIRVDHFKPDSHARATGVDEGWAVVRVGDCVLGPAAELPQLMHHIKAGLGHLPHESKGLRMDFLDRNARKRTLYFQRQPLGLVIGRSPPRVVEGFNENSYARERGVEVGWQLQRVGAQEVAPSASSEEVTALLRERSRALPPWPLRVDLDTGRGYLRAIYIEARPVGLELSDGPPFKILGFDAGSQAQACRAEVGWAVVRVGNSVVHRETDRGTVERLLLEGSSHLPEAEHPGA